MVAIFSRPHCVNDECLIALYVVLYYNWSMINDTDVCINEMHCNHVTLCSISATANTSFKLGHIWRQFKCELLFNLQFSLLHICEMSMHVTFGAWRSECTGMMVFTDVFPCESVPLEKLSIDRHVFHKLDMLAFCVWWQKYIESNIYTYKTCTKM